MAVSAALARLLATPDAGLLREQTLLASAHAHDVTRTGAGPSRVDVVAFVRVGDGLAAAPGGLLKGQSLYVNSYVDIGGGDRGAVERLRNVFWDIDPGSR